MLLRKLIFGILVVRAATLEETPTVRTKQGIIVGSVKYPSAIPGVERFAGIPYAITPLRFTRAKLNTEPFEGGLLNATVPGAPCIQNPLGDPRPPGHAEAPPPSEDCLTLNVWRPRPEKEKVDYPVLVWIFGGGLCSGAANNRFHDGSIFAKKHNVIVVSVSYRLGALGFLTFEDGFDGGGSGGMNGIYDIAVALKWVRANIAYFGGREKDVTIFGQSSGGYAACTLSVAPVSKGLFERAILQSGPCWGGPAFRSWGPRNISRGVQVSREVMRSLNATTLDDLRKIEAERIQWPENIMNFDTSFSGYFDDDFVVPPVTDGSSASSSNVEARWKSGRIVPSAIIVGFNSKDGTSAFYGEAPLLGNVPPDPTQTTPEDYRSALFSAWDRDTAERILKHYDLDARFNGSVQAAYIQSDADAYVICPSLEIGFEAAKHNVSVWAYEFNHFQPNREDRRGFGCDNGVELDVVSPVHPISTTWASHGAETHFVFSTEIGSDGLGPPNNLTRCAFTDAERALSESMMSYWASFADVGDPNGPGTSCNWMPITSDSGNDAAASLLLFGDENSASAIAQVSGRHERDCAFWSGLSK